MIDAQMSVILTIHNAKKSIGPRTLFEGLSFGVESQSRIGLVGPNGAGKSTLLRCLAGLDRLEHGQITWSRNVKVEYVPQSPIYSKDISIEDFILSDNEDSPEQIAKMWEYFSKINFPEFDLSKKFHALSGGEQKKSQIIKALLRNPDVLLMDEPTNHLDVESIMWVEEFLNTQPQLGYILVSHDRLFLQNTVTEMIELNASYREGYIRSKGGYAEYLELKNATVHAQQVHQQKRENTLRREMEWLRRGAIARLKKQVARQNATHDLKADVDLLKSLNRNREIQIEMQTSGRSPKKLVEMEGVGLQINDRHFFADLDLVIHRRTRLGLLGANGSGKTTFINSILKVASDSRSESSKKTLPIVYNTAFSMTGRMKTYEDIQINYFDQKRYRLDPDISLLRNLVSEGDYVQVKGQPIFARSYLDRFNFRRDQHDLLVRELSGGEQNRLMLAQLMTTECQLMILDEPTNDLDFETLASLKDSLEEFDGAIILVSHDRTFLDEVCTEILYFPNDDESASSEKKNLVKFSSFLQWQDWRDEKSNKKSVVVESPATVEKSKKTVRLSYKEQREFDTIEAVILKKEEESQSLKNLMLTPEIAQNANRLLEISQQAFGLDSEVEKLYLRWQELEKKQS